MIRSSLTVVNQNFLLESRIHIYVELFLSLENLSFNEAELLRQAMLSLIVNLNETSISEWHSLFEGHMMTTA